MKGYETDKFLFILDNTARSRKKPPATLCCGVLRKNETVNNCSPYPLCIPKTRIVGQNSTAHTEKAERTRCAFFRLFHIKENRATARKINASS